MSRLTAKVLVAAQNAVTKGIRIPIKYRDIIKEKFIKEFPVDPEKHNLPKGEMYSVSDQKRPHAEAPASTDHLSDPHRSEFRRDYGRVIHSPGFRRLQGKTQLFPSIESDFFRNRLTHSLEVAQIAKSIANIINHTFLKDTPKRWINTDVVEVAALSHDIGHTPFGHQGEEALNECMWDCGGFEGNAQTLRLLSRLEKKRTGGKLECGGFENGVDKRFGLNLTYRSFASVLKYDTKMPMEMPVVNEEKEETKKGVKIKSGLKKHKVLKGYYASEEDLAKEIKKAVAPGYDGLFKTIECQIMDIADDIAYSTFDLEDAFKAKFISPLDIINLDDAFFVSVSDLVNKEFEKKEIKVNGAIIKVDYDQLGDIVSDLFKDVLFKIETFEGFDKVDDGFFKSEEFRYLSTQYADRYSYYLANDGYVRSNFTSQLIDDALSNIQFEYNDHYPALSKISLDVDALLRIEILKQIAFRTQILSPKLKIAEYRGKQIVTEIFNALCKNPDLLPWDFGAQFHECDSANSEGALSKNKKRIICDYIACMTDKYAIEFYGRLTSETPETIFKPF